MRIRPTSRRTFIKQSALAAAAISFPARSWARVAGANEAIRVAVIGTGGRGGNHIGGMRNLAEAGVRITALCDVDSRRTASSAAPLERQGEKVFVTQDMRRIFDRQDIDVVTIATPNHWHALATIWAVQSGKDVYVEKPVCHNVWEGRQMVEIVKKTGRIVQCGTQSRSSFGIQQAVDWVREGHLGQIMAARGFCYKARKSIGTVSGPQPVPEGVDYDLWCGPAPMDPIMRKDFHYDWHWFWYSGNGDLGNQGIHQMDICRWFLGEPALSPRVWSVGARVGYADSAETANTQIVYHDYDKAPLIFEVRGLPRNQADQTDSWTMDRFNPASPGVGVQIDCEGGYVIVPNYNEATAFDPQGKEIKRWRGSKDHYENFIQAVRSRNTQDLTGKIEDGAISSSLCHTGNISYMLGSKKNPAEILDQIKGDRYAAKAFEGMSEHLAKNGVDLALDQLTIGPLLRMNPRTERFTNSSEANVLLTRKFRAPYIVPAHA